jgi:hypothetical protein
MAVTFLSNKSNTRRGLPFPFLYSFLASLSLGSLVLYIHTPPHMHTHTHHTTPMNGSPTQTECKDLLSRLPVPRIVYITHTYPHLLNELINVSVYPSPQPGTQ